MTNPKKPITFRLDDDTHDRLKTLAKGGATVSYLINQAIAQFLDGKPDIPPHERPAIIAEEVEAILPALKIIGKPVHINLFFELIETQQGR